MYDEMSRDFTLPFSCLQGIQHIRRTKAIPGLATTKHVTHDHDVEVEAHFVLIWRLVDLNKSFLSIERQKKSKGGIHIFLCMCWLDVRYQMGSLGESPWTFFAIETCWMGGGLFSSWHIQKKKNWYSRFSLPLKPYRLHQSSPGISNS